MDRNVRYEVLAGEEEDVPAQPVAMAMVVPPPPYQENGSTQSTASGYGDTKLPSYVDATTLPSYEEAERTKQEEVQRLDEESQRESGHDQFSDMTVGTDGMFICTFVIAFLFNWVGYLLSMCISNTVAGRCGALAGLGLSVVKWVAIVKHNNWAQDFAAGDSWLWWVLALSGFLLFIRGSILYVRVKYAWNQLNGRVHHYRLL